jgi:hypothetical protein
MSEKCQQTDLHILLSLDQLFSFTSDFVFRPP